RGPRDRVAARRAPPAPRLRGPATPARSWCSRRRCPSRGPRSLRVIPVLDLRAGRAVLARGGRRETYALAQSVLLGADRAGDPVALARAYRDALGLEECYVADLDAIGGGPVQSALLRRLAGVGSVLLVVAGVADPVRARDVRAARAARGAVGLETLASLRPLAAAGRAGGL